MAAIKPFSYLTGETRPPLKSGFRRPDEAYGTSPQVNASPRPTRSPKTSGDGSNMIQRPTPEPPNKDLSNRAINNVHRDADSQLQGSRVQQTATDAEYRREQQKTSDLKNRLEIAAAAPDRAAPPGRTNEQTDKSLVADVPCTSRDHFYGKRQMDAQTGKTKTETNLDTADNNGQFLHDPRAKGRQKEIIAIEQNSSSAASSASCEIPAPYSYTEPMRPAPFLQHGAAVRSPLDGQYRKKPGPGEGRIDDNPDYLCPTSPPMATDNLLDNFILAGGPSSSKADSSGGQVGAGEPTKRLKLQELFDPPPPPPPVTMPTPPTRRYSIHGVTNTESSDYHHHHHQHHHVVLDNKISNPKNGNANYNGIKGPAGTLDNPDYGMTGDGTEAGSSLHEFRSVSNSTDRTGKASAPAAADNAQRCRCDRRLCLAIVITALVTSVICLGSGFVAGWFGKETCKGNGEC